MRLWNVLTTKASRNEFVKLEERSFLQGDINGDGKISVADQALLADHVAGKILEEDARYDVNMDGKVTIADQALFNELFSGSAVAEDSERYIGFSPSVPDEQCIVFIRNIGTKEVTIKALPGTFGAVEKTVSIPVGNFTAFTFDSGYFKQVKGDTNKGKILFYSSSGEIAMSIVELI